MQYISRHNISKAAAIAVIILTVTLASGSTQLLADDGSAEHELAENGLAENGLTAMSHAAEQALEAHWAADVNRVEITMATMDPRLQVPVCAEPLVANINQASQNANGGRVTVRVDCPGDAPWSRHVAASVKVFRPVVVSSRALPRGTVVTESDVFVEELDVSLLRGHILENADGAIGQSMRRALNAGAPLTLDILTPPILIKRGDAVVLTAQRNGVSIRQTGTAMQDGEKGRQIPVRNTSSDRVIQAIVTGSGEAEVIF
mgnify:CR=1 FL=1|tara:strand:- start:4388 stop:5167 length:780 start_codon:yes stop_codon:yes gene_type:complete